MSEPTTLRTLAGMPATPASLADSTLIMIDLQNTYTRGVMELEGVQPALDQAAELLDRARIAGIPVIHIQHDDGEGGLYDVRAEIGRIVDRVAPRDGETVIVENYPNSFTGTELNDRLAPGSNLVLAGFMTHMCINSTARGAFSLGHSPIGSPAPARRGHCWAQTGAGDRRRPAGGEPGRDRRPVRSGGPEGQRDPRLTTGRRRSRHPVSGLATPIRSGATRFGQPASERWTTSNSSRDEPDATGRARSPEWAVMAGPCSQAWNDSSVSQCVTTK